MGAYNCTSASATGLILRLGLHVTALSSGTCRHNNVAQLKVITLGCELSGATFPLTGETSQIRSFGSVAKWRLLDRMITAVLGMNCTIPWQRVRVKPFTSIVAEGGTLDERAFSRHGELWHLWDSFMDQM